MMRVGGGVPGKVLQAWLAGCLLGQAAKVAPARMEEWSRQLGDRQYAVRETATREIWNLGPEALPWLEVAAKDPSMPERMLRARDLIRKIRYEITPDSDPKIIEWVEAYVVAKPGDKVRLLGLLKGKRAWLTMLRLVADETNPELRAKLEPALEGVAQRAARECLSSGQTERARLALELAPNDEKSLMAWAVFHRQQGTWQQAWNGLDEKDRKGAKALALLRAAGRIGEARQLASQAQDKLLAAWLAALEGDPLDWLERLNPEMGRTESEYVKYAKRRWSGAAMRSDDWEALSQRASGKEGNYRNAATQLLFLLGEPGLAATAMAKHTPLTAFLFYDQTERIPEALAAMGIDLENPDYRSWFRKKLEGFRKQDIDNQRGVDDTGAQLIAMAGFLERRGQGDVLWDAFAEPLADFAREERIAFVDFLSQLFGSQETSSGAPVFSAAVAAKWAGEDEDKWLDVLTSAFGDDQDVKQWWSLLGKLEPRLALPERLALQMALFRMGPDPKGLRAATLSKALDAAKRDPEWVAVLGRLATNMEDASVYAAVEKMLPEETVKDMFWGQRMNLLSAMGRWSDVADLLLGHIGKQTEGGKPYTPEIHIHAYAAGALRLAGREEEARKHDALADSLYLGDYSYALRIGHGYAFAMDFKRAMLWWERACVEGSINDSNFSQAIKALADGSLEAGQWLRSASLSECLLRYYANSDYRFENPLSFSQIRLQADVARAISRLDTQRAQAVADLERCHQAYVTDGSLADVFFPSLRRAGLIKEHDRCFQTTWAKLRTAIRQFPEADNSRNTAAWISARAARSLDEGLADIQAALAKRPDQAAYLDTMAEIQFARGNRKKAIEWSSRAMAAMPSDPVIRRQHARFVHDPLPK